MGFGLAAELCARVREYAQQPHALVLEDEPAFCNSVVSDQIETTTFHEGCAPQADAERELRLPLNMRALVSASGAARIRSGFQ